VFSVAWHAKCNKVGVQYCINPSQVNGGLQTPASSHHSRHWLLQACLISFVLQDFPELFSGALLSSLAGYVTRVTDHLVTRWLASRQRPVLCLAV
jgi:hypothetical protein